MKRNLLVVVGALAMTWQTASAADPTSVDAAEVKTPASSVDITAASAPAPVTIVGRTQPVNAVADAPASSAPAATERELPCKVIAGGEPSCCNPCGNQCGQGGRIIGGLGLYLIQPYFENNPAFTVTRFGGGAVVEQTDRTDVRHHMSLAPELWLGYLGENGLGVRVRWWYFRQGTEQSMSFGSDTDPIMVESAGPLGITAFGDNEGPLAMVVTSKLQLQVLDLEGLHQQQTCGWDLLLSGGARLAHINQHYNAYVAGDSGSESGDIQVDLTSGHSFHGIGPTFALQVRHPVADSCLAFFGTVRGALLFGSAKQSVVDAFTPGDEPTEFAFAQDHRTRVMPVGELELGVEYARRVCAGQAFGQFAVVGQDWLGAGNASRSTQDNFLGVPTGSSIIDNDLGFLGFVFRVGLNY